MPRSSNGARAWVAMLVGGLIAAIAAISYLVYAGRPAAPRLGQNVDLSLSLPKAPPMPEGPRLPDPPIPVPR